MMNNNYTTGRDISDALKQARRCVYGKDIPDPSAQGILYGDWYAWKKGLDQAVLPETVEALQVIAEHVQAWRDRTRPITVLGAGIEAVIVQLSDRACLRLQPGGTLTRPNVPEVVQTVIEGEVNGLKFDVEPICDTANITWSHTFRLDAALWRRSLQLSDFWPQNVAKHEGQLVVIDPGAVKEVSRLDVLKDPHRASLLETAATIVDPTAPVAERLLRVIDLARMKPITVNVSEFERIEQALNIQRDVDGIVAPEGLLRALHVAFHDVTRVPASDMDILWPSLTDKVSTWSNARSYKVYKSHGSDRER